MRHAVLACCLLLGTLSLTACGGSTPPPVNFQVAEASIAAIESGFKSGTVNCHQLVQLYLSRIAGLDHAGPALNSLLDINPDALTIADALDAAYARSGPVGPLHCIPLIVKDNYDTADQMPTRAASLTMDSFTAAADAYAIARLRAAGAVPIAKANMDEWANGVAGYSSRGGQTLDAYRLDRIPGGSSGGSAVAVAASLGVIATGSDTAGSIRIPAAFNDLVGIKPTLGLLSRAGVIPFSLNFDVPGPLARSVADAATMLGVMTGVDPADPATAASAGHFYSDYTQFLDPNGLGGARVGILNDVLGLPLSGENAEVDAALSQAASQMQILGAAVSGVVIPEPPSGDQVIGAVGVLASSFSDDLAAYFATYAPDAPVQSLAQIVSASLILGPQVVKVLPSLQDYLDTPAPTPAQLASARQVQAELTAAIVGAMDSAQLDALVFPTMLCPATPLPGVVDNGYQCAGAPPMPFSFGASYGGQPILVASLTGLPEITVPAGFTSDGLPITISFLGRPWSEPTLIRLAYAYEQSTHWRSPPRVVDARQSVEHLRVVAQEYGSRVPLWRYDPIIISSLTPPDYHRSNFSFLAKQLRGATDEVVVSVVQVYQKTRHNMDRAAKDDGFSWSDPNLDEKRSLLRDLASIAAEHQMRLTICTQPDLLIPGAGEARCIDAQRLTDISHKAFRTRLKGMRRGCGCFESIDIGDYDTCPHGCVYCYAVRNRRLALERYQAHDPHGEYLFPLPPAKQRRLFGAF